MNKCQGTIIRRIPLTESSMIVTWCTKDHGLLKTVAKGARRPKSQFSGKLDLFYEAEFEIIRSKKTDLHNLREMKILMTRASIRQSYLKTLSASYFAKMIDKVSESDSPINSLYELFTGIKLSGGKRTSIISNSSLREGDDKNTWDFKSR